MTAGPNRAAALDWVADVLAVRAALLDAVGEGRVDLAGLFDDAARDPLEGEVKLLSVLEALPGARKIDTRRALAALGVDGRTHIGALSSDQIRVIVESFPLAATSAAAALPEAPKEPT